MNIIRINDSSLYPVCYMENIFSRKVSRKEDVLHDVVSIIITKQHLFNAISKVLISCSSITLRELYSAAAEIIGEETTYLLSTNFFMIGDKLVFNLCVHFCLLILGEIGPWCGKITSIWRKRCSRYHFFPLPFLEIIE